MSIIISQIPNFITTSDNPLVYVFNQSLYRPSNGLPKYKISFIVKVSIAAAGEVGIFEIFPENIDYSSSKAYGKIDVSNIIKNFLKEPFIKPYFSGNYLFDQSFSAGNLYVEVIEKYSITETGQTALYLSASAETRFVFKACLSRNEFLKTNFNSFKFGSVTNRFLTDKPSTLYNNVRYYTYDFLLNDTFTISYLDYEQPIGTNNNKFLNVDIVDTFNETYNFELYYESYQQGILNTIYFNFNELLENGHFGVEPFFGQIKSISFSVWDAVLYQSKTPVVILNIVQPCFYSGKSIHFLNKYGGFDYYLFKNMERKNASINKFEYQIPDGEFNFDGTYSLVTEKSGRRTYLKQITEKLQLTTDYLSQDEQNWFVQLYESPSIYINEGVNFEPVTVTNNTYTIKQDRYDELYNEIVDLEFTNKNSIHI